MHPATPVRADPDRLVMAACAPAATTPSSAPASATSTADASSTPTTGSTVSSQTHASPADLDLHEGEENRRLTGNYNDGIASKDGLAIASGTIDVTAVDDGIRGRDYLVMETGTVVVDAEGDALKADNASWSSSASMMAS